MAHINFTLVVATSVVGLMTFIGITLSKVSRTDVARVHARRNHPTAR